MLNSEGESEDNLHGISDDNVMINDAASDFNVDVADDPSSPWTHFLPFDVMCAPNFIWEMFLVKFLHIV